MIIARRYNMELTTMPQTEPAPTNLKDGIYDLPTVNRVEVIDHTGRLLVLNPVKVQISPQDEGRTLKIFITP